MSLTWSPGRRTPARIVLLVVAASSLVLHAPPAQAAEDDAARQLADRYAPVVRLQADAEDCDQGEQFQPTDVEAVLGDQQVALRGPWEAADLVSTQPESEELGRRYPGHFLDFPGDPLRPGCTYAEWSARINAEFEPTVYAHVATDSRRPGQISLQYWFFYVFNDYNNTHEGDWEAIHLIFDAPTADEALLTAPVAVGYSQHGGAERALWGDDKLEIVDGTHPVVYPAAGSHANKFGAQLYIGSGEEGLGCDDTTHPLPGITPRLAFVPSATDDYVNELPWLAFEGRWGERQGSVFNGPTGPSQKGSWTAPIRDAESSWRDDSTTVPAGTSLGPNSTTVFCGVVSAGSNLVRETLDRPWLLVLTLAAVVGLVWLAASRTRWTGSDPLPARARRDWGQCVTCAVLTLRRHPALFASLGLVFVPLALATGLLAWFQTTTPDAADLTAPTDEYPGAWVGLLALAVTVLTIAAYAALLAAAAGVLARLDRDEDASSASAVGDVVAARRPLIAVTLRYSLVVTLLLTLVATIPLAGYYAVSRVHAIPIVVVEGRSAGEALRQSRAIVRGRWWRTAAALVIVAGLGIGAGPVTGIVLLLATGWSPVAINLISSVIFAVALPLVALAVTYLYFDRAASSAAESADAAIRADPAAAHA